MTDDQPGSGDPAFHAEVSARFGLMPNFFRSAPAAPGLIEELWAFARSAYLDSPLPSLFKERLFVHLSRFCEVRYCVIRHVGFLIGEGRPAGDPAATPETVAQALALLRRPMPDAAALDAACRRLEAQAGTAAAPLPETQDEADLFDALTAIFLAPTRSTHARQAVRHFMGEQGFEILAAFLAFVRTAHYWTQTHPDLGCEPDMAALMARHPDLAAALLDLSDARLVMASEELRAALTVERSRAEAALAESEELRRIAVEGARMGTWRWNLRDDLIWGDAAFLGLWGFAPSDAPRPLADFAGRMSPQGQAEMAEIVSRAREAGEAFDGQLAVVSGPTEGRWVRWRGRAERERPWLVNGVSFDVTDQRRRDDRLRDSEARFRALATTGAFSIYRMSPDWRLMYQLDGGTLATTADPIEHWVEKYIPDDDLPAVREAIDRAIRTKSMFELEHRVRLADGGIGWVLSRAVPLLDDAGEIVKWFGAGSDVTERREAVEALRTSEARHQALFAASPVPLLVLAANPPDFTITAANDAYFAATLTTPDTLIGRRLFDLFTDDPRRPGQLGSEALALSLDRVLTTKRTDAMGRVRYDLVTPQGFEPNWWEATNAPLFDGDGNVAAIIHQVTRQTELHHAEEAQREHERRQTFLLKLSDALRPLVDAGEIQRVAARLIGEYWGVKAHYAPIETIDGRDHFVIRHAYALPGRSASDFDYPVDEFPGLVDGMLSGVMAVSDVAADPRLTASDKASIAAAGVGAYLMAPLVKNGRLEAIFSAHVAQPRTWTQEEEALSEEVAERTRAAVERARAEAALRESEAKYRTLFENMGQGFTLGEVVRDEQGRAVDLRYLELNPAFERLSGIPVAQAQGRTVREVYGQVEPEWFEVAERVARLKVPERVEYEIGAIGRWFQMDFYPTEGDRYLGLYEDVTERRLAERALRDSEERQAFLLRLSDALRVESSVEAVGDRAVRMIAEALALDRVFFVTAGLDAGLISVTHDVRRDDMPEMLGTYTTNDFPNALKKFLQQPIMYTDVRTDPRLSDHDRSGFAGLGAAGFAAVPIRRGSGTLIWAIGAVSTEPRQWTAGDIRLLEEAAERSWAAIERTRADAALRESEQALAADLASTSLLRELADRLVTEEDLATIHGEILAAAITITRADAGTVQVYEPETRSLVLLATSGLEPAMTDYFHRVDAASSTGCGTALRDGRRVFVDYDPEGTDDDGRRHVAAGLYAAQATPLISRDGAPLGMLNTHWRASGHRPTERELRFLDLLARQAADLIERAQAQRRLRDSEERLRQFGEASQDVLWIRDAETLQWTYLTPAFEAIYGLSREEALTGDSYRSWLDLVVAEDRDRVMESIQRVRDGEQVAFEFRIRRPVDGAIRWLRNTDFPIADEYGHVGRIGGIGSDITDLREAEQRLHTLIAGIPQLVWRAVGDGHWTWASPQWTVYTGQAEADSHDRGWLEVVHPDDRARTRDTWAGAASSGEFQADYRICHAGEDRYRWFQARATPVRDASGAIIEWLGTSTDVDDLRRLQERQYVLVGELQHRTRNLMGLVRSMADRTGDASRDFPEFRERFQDRLEALARVQSLLSRLSDTDRVAFDELIETELHALDGSARQVTLDGPKGIRLRSSMVQTLGLALHELVTNATKYGALSQPDARLAIRWRMAPPDQRGRPWLHIDWRESGVAMPALGPALIGSGQGRELIEGALPYQLSARTSFYLGPDGVHCTIAIPVSAGNIQEGDDHG